MVGKKPWQRGGGRRHQDVLPRRRLLIVCEDEKSSRYYFESFPIDRQRAEVVAIGTGLNTDHLVERAVELVSRESRKGTPYGDVWCVFDRDSFPESNYARAFDLARTHRFHVAWSNGRLNCGTFSTSTTSTLGFQGGSTPKSSLRTSVTTKQTGASTIV